MHIMHMALGGCLKAPPVAYGLTEDTGGHIAYVLGCALAQSARSDVTHVEIVTRAFDDATLGAVHAQSHERIDGKTSIRRIRSARGDYLEKDGLEAELPALTEAFLAALGERSRPDVIHAHFADAAALALAARARFGIPVVYTPHSLGLGKRGCVPTLRGTGAITRRIARERDAIARVDAIVVSSRDEGERQLDAYGLPSAGRVHRIEPGVHFAHDSGGTRRAVALVDRFLAVPDKPLILAIARPVAKKNLRALVDAYALTPGLSDAANLAVVAGQDRDANGRAIQNDLHDAAARHGLAGRVAMPTRHDARDVPELYRLAARRRGVFVNPALHEPFGLTIIEAATARLPVVATDQGGPVDILRAIGHGVCVEPTDRDALGRAILRAVTDRRWWDACAGRAAAGSALYSWDVYAERSRALYAALRPARAREVPRAAARRLVACDVDGTLTGDRVAAERFAAWVAEGHAPFVVATGRSMPEARRVLAAWGLPMPRTFITSVGTEIWHADGPARAEMDPSYAARIARGWDVDAVAAVLAAAGAEPQAAVEQRAFKRSYLGDETEAARLREALDAAGMQGRVVASHGNLIDVLPARAGKAAAIAHVARLFDLTMRDCVAAGDSGNDRDMLEAAGAAIVVGNARDGIARLRGAGIYHARTAHAAGVLEGLRQVGLAPAHAVRVRRRDLVGMPR